MVRTMIARKKIFGYSLVIVLSVLAIVISVSMKIVNLAHWFEIQFMMVSYHPWIPVMGLTASGLLLLITYVKKQFWIYYVLFGFGIIYNIFLLYGVLITNGGIFI